MTAPNLSTSHFRLSNKNFRIAFLVSLVVAAVAVFSATNSFAGSIKQRLLASMMGGTTSAHNSAAVEFAEAAQTQSSTMTVERRGHTATRLSDGRVLIAGGENSSGALNQSEIYDPASATFSPAANMGAARVDHSATLLADGRVLIGGGRNGGGSLATTEIFDPAAGGFTNGPSMSVARAGHSATLFANGRVFIAGGEAGGSAEILDLAAGTSAPAGNMGVARSMHSAALLQDGRVLVVGGRANGNELTSGEIFDNGIFSPLNNELKVNRVRAHLRVLFDGKVQIIGGSNDGSMEIYDPAFAGFGAYAHVLPDTDTCTNLKPGILTAQTRAALFYNGQTDALLDRSGHTITELAGNQALVLGGINSASTVLNSAELLASSPASISTDKMDYLPGDTVTINGRGYQPGETVRVKIHEDPHTPQERGFDIVADADGNFSGTYLVADNDLLMKFIVSARGLTSGWTAHTTFTDGNAQATGTVTNSVTGLPIAGASVFCSLGCVGGTTTNGAGGYFFQFNFPGNNALVQITASAPGFLPTTVSALFANNQTQTINFALTPIQRATSTTVSCTPNPTVVGDGVSCTTTVNDIAGAGATPPLGTVNLVTGGTGNFTPAANCSLSPISGSASSCSVTYTPTQHGTGTHNIVSSYAGSSNHTGSTSPPFPLTVNKRDTLTTVSSSLNPSTFGQSVTFTATVVGTGAGVGNPTSGLVQFKIDGVNFGGPVPLVAGSASSSATSSLSAGNHTVEAVFTSTDPNFNNSSDLLDGGQTVNKRDTLTTVSSSLNPSTFGESVTFTATVVGTGAGAGNPTAGSVQFKIDGANFGGPVALAGGSASSGAINTLNAGNHTVEAIFTSADTNFNDSNDLLDGGQTVNKRDTLTTVSSSLNPSTFGESVTFTATVVGTGAGAGNPTAGSVQFKIDGANFGAPVALAGGSASSSAISSLTAGNHTVEAIFTSADANFNDSNDLLDGGQTVNKRDTLTTLSSSLNPSTFGESVTFTA
ncbi:MAG TPA: Ig-like domain repeat protein, partial [Pyrinomonadaceae bacterium]|nr:Ig-like domain repeat protein [Pyrinomonadaceae bacterium]